jgi:hypothetical protein
MVRLQKVALVRQHRRDLQLDAGCRQQPGDPLIDPLLVEIAAPKAAERNHAAPIVVVGGAHRQSEPLGRHLNDPAVRAANSDRGLDRIVHDRILSRAEPESITSPATSGESDVNTCVCATAATDRTTALRATTAAI